MRTAAIREPTIGHDVVRTAVLDLLDQRWDATVTTVRAGAGFGKSIALGQAVRANRAAPRGVEGWVSCSGCEDPARLAAAVRRAFGTGDAPHTAGGPPAQVREAAAALAPVDAVLVLDDAEALAGRPGCVALLTDLVRNPPANLHLVLAGRELPALPLARLRAAGEVVDVTEDDLRFGPTEIEALAAALGGRVPAEDLGGWPALVRLAVAAPEAVGDYLWEEVIDGLGPADRRALLALCLLGPAGPADVEAVAGAPVDPEAFCARVPLVHQAGDRIVAHQLWAPYTATLVPAADRVGLARRALAVVEERGDVVATGALALRLGDDAALRRAALGLVRSTLASLPSDVAEGWLAAAGHEAPELELLACAAAHARSVSEPPPARLDAVWRRFHDGGDTQGEGVALAVATTAAEAGGDIGRLVELSGRARTLAGADHDPLLGLLVAGVDAALAASVGDVDAALGHLERPIPGLNPAHRPELVNRLHWHLLILAGRAGEAAALADTLAAGPPDAVARELGPVARWLDGDPSGLARDSAELGAARYEGLNDRDRFDQAGFVAVLAASAGAAAGVDRAVDVLRSSPLAGAGASASDAALVTVARAAQRIMCHDDAGAAAVVEGLVGGLDLDRDPLADALLRRSPAIGYVCSPTLAVRWDGQALGPSQRRACAVAQALVTARAGRVPAREPAPPPTVATALPLPWAVELAVRAAAAGTPWGAPLVGDLHERFGDPVASELMRWAGHGDDRARAAAAELWGTLPVAAPAAVEIRVLGELEVWRDGRPVGGAELRRARVRELLTVLVVERALTRDRAMDLLWPGLDVERARGNLRVTLSHLRRLLEPGRPAGDPAYFVRADSEHVRLPEVAGLTVDLWEAQRCLADADAARRAGDVGARADRLGAATARWRGRPLPDLDRVADLATVGHQVTATLVDAVLERGELDLIAGSARRAAACADRALAADPYRERAHRLAVAAHLQARDRPATAATVERLGRVLDELGVDPEDTTAMLLRQADAWLTRTREPALVAH
ncbi:MAG TPA: BTAD domain-containing putative transcriptional regulator [Acidimicrobiales bacterium]|nr:BTAD domain-containing putative transcriptional regulator [Acidimicrobiales bacterium]